MSFFKYPVEIYNDASAREVVPIIMELVNPKSVIDIGCGTGTWLSVFEKHGVKRKDVLCPFIGYY